MIVPGGMPPGGYAMPGHAMSGYPMPGGPMMGGYPGMPPVMPYPPPLAGDGGMPCGGCCDGGCGGEACCGCPTFGRYGGCPDDECCCCPVGDGTAHWRARIEPVLLTFRLPKQPSILSTTNLNGTAGIGNLDFDNELSVRLSLEAKLPDGSSLETVFLPYIDWSDSESLVNANGFASPYQTFLGAVVIPYDGATQHDYSYTSRLSTWELNYWRPLVKHSLFQSATMIGTRYMCVEEDFGYNALGIFAGNTISGTTNINAENHMAFIQVGMTGWFPLARQVSVRSDAKAAAGYNFGSQTTDIATAGNPAGDTVYSEEAESDAGTYMAELSTVISWQVNCYCALYAGYQAMWLEQLVLAPENFNSTFPTNGFRPVLIDNTGHRLYHGVIGGLEITW
jgi:hypothetical protein